MVQQDLSLSGRKGQVRVFDARSNRETIAADSRSRFLHIGVQIDESNEDTGRHRINCRISPKLLRIFWAGAGPQDIQGTVPFPEPLRKNEWHYYAQTWSEGEFAVYLDGRLVFTHDMREVKAIVNSRVDKPGVYIGGASAGGSSYLRMALDELAVSTVVRYTGDFEPSWHDGARPAYAFAGLDEPPRRYDSKARLPVVAESFAAQFAGEPLRVDLA